MVVVDRLALTGETVVRLKGGDSYGLGRGGDAVHACLAAGATVAVLRGVTALTQFVTAAVDGAVRADIPVAIIEKGTTSHERITRGMVSTIVRIAKETGVKPPAIIVIGQVAHPGLLASELAVTR